MYKYHKSLSFEYLIILWTKLSEESVSAIELNEQQYFGTDMKIRCVVRDILGNRVTSDEADLHVIINQTPLAITKQPENCHVEASGTASFSVEAEGPGLTYLWQYIYPSRSFGQTKSQGFPCHRRAQ